MDVEIINVFKTWMAGEINNFIKVWISVYLSLSYCYFSTKIVPKGLPRLLTFLPVISLFLILPLYLHTVHLGGTTAFFVAWLSNFKLLMFAFGIGPLSDPSLSLLHFLAIASLPIRIQKTPPQNPRDKQNPSSNGQFQENPSLKNGLKSLPNPQNKQNPSTNGNFQENPSPKNGHKSPLVYFTKGLLVALFIRVYDYSEYIHRKILLFIYCFHMYFMLEIILAMVAVMARTLLGLELEPQFKEPYLSTSLQDFWGRRWNLMVTRILRPTVYDPTLNISTRVLGRKWAPLPAILSTFIVSALMHELIFYYLGRVRPTGAITCFFLIHGVCLAAEVAMKKAVNGRWRLPQLISRLLTVVFVLATGYSMFLPEFLKFKVEARAIADYAAVGAFVKNVGRVLINVSKA